MPSGGEAQGPEHEEVGSEPDHGGHGEGDDEGDRHWHLTGVAERDLTGRFSESVGRMSTHGRKISPWFHAWSNVATPYIAIAPMGEVDDARALVDDHQAGAQHGVERPDADAGDQVRR